MPTLLTAGSAHLHSRSLPVHGHKTALPAHPVLSHQLRGVLHRPPGAPLLSAPSQPLHLAISPSGCPPNSCPPGRKAGPAHPHHHLRTGLWSQQSARPDPAYSCLPPMGQQSPSEAHVTCSPGAQCCLSCLLQQNQWRRLCLGRAIGREGTCGQSGSSGCPATALNRGLGQVLL